MANTKIEYAKGGTDYRTKGTISCWVKRSRISVQQDIWSFGENNSSDAYLRFDTADNIEMHCDGAGGTFNTSSLYRDINGWFHFVFSLDGSNSTANMRRRFWINGVQIDEGSGKNDIAAFSGAVLGWHSTQDLWIGARARSQQSGDVEYFDGLMSHFHYCSNYSYAASDFGSFDSTTGEWKINTSPNVQYGSEGFFLKMEDSSNLDLDSSGNNKSLTTSGTLTSTKDCPSNVVATWNAQEQWYFWGAAETSNITNGNTTAQSGNSQYATLPATLGVNSGKFYWEVEYDGNNGGNDYSIIGITANQSVAVDKALGDYANDWGYYKGGSNSLLRNNNGTTSWGTPYNAGDIVGVALDCTNNKLYFSKNGVWQESGNPSAGSGGISISAASSTPLGFYFPACSYFDGTYHGRFKANFGNGFFGTTAITTNSGNGYAGAENASKFYYPVPTNYSALNTKGLNQ